MSVLFFTLLLGGMVHVMAWSGGTTAMARLFLGSSRSPRRAMFGAFGLGLAVFFDGLANAMLVGKTMRPLAARAGVSPEKLSFIVDSTSSPIAGLALISTWVAYEMSVIREGLAHIGGLEDISAFSLLVASLPFRYYNYFILAVVFFVVWLGRDFGPMLAAERATTRDKKTREPPAAAVWGRIWLAVIPLGLLILAVPVGLYIDGGAADRPISWLSFAEAFGKADAARVSLGLFNYTGTGSVYVDDLTIWFDDGFIIYPSDEVISVIRNHSDNMNAK
jgi:Na+/H+ antiporter NhaC